MVHGLRISSVTVAWLCTLVVSTSVPQSAVQGTSEPADSRMQYRQDHKSILRGAGFHFGGCRKPSGSFALKLKAARGMALVERLMLKRPEMHPYVVSKPQYLYPVP